MLAVKSSKSITSLFLVFAIGPFFLSCSAEEPVATKLKKDFENQTGSKNPGSAGAGGKSTTSQDPDSANPPGSSGAGGSVENGESMPQTAQGNQLSLVDGQAVYAQKCQSCHNPIDSSTKSNRSASQISASQTISAHSGVAWPSAEEVEAIAKALVR